MGQFLSGSGLPPDFLSALQANLWGPNPMVAGTPPPSPPTPSGSSALATSGPNFQSVSGFGSAAAPTPAMANPYATMNQAYMTGAYNPTYKAGQAYNQSVAAGQPPVRLPVPSYTAPGLPTGI